MRISIFLLIFVYSVDGDKKHDKNVEIGVKVVMAGLKAVPIVGDVIGILDPVLDELWKEENDGRDMKIIQQGFGEIQAAIAESTGRLVTEIGLIQLREIESKGKRLLENLANIMKQETPESAKRSVAEFLRECHEDKPYQRILDMKRQIVTVLLSQLVNDVYHSKTNLNKTERMLYSTLHELTLVTVFQQYLNQTQSVENRDLSLRDLRRTLEEIQDEANKVLRELKEYDYWPGLKTIVNSALTDVDKQNLNARAERITKHIFDIYTNDRMCVKLLPGKRNSYRTNVEMVSPYDESEYRNTENQVQIIRQRRLAYNFDEDAVRKAVEESGFLDGKCPWSRGNREKWDDWMPKLGKLNLSVILSNMKRDRSNTFYEHDFSLDRSIVKCDENAFTFTFKGRCLDENRKDWISGVRGYFFFDLIVLPYGCDEEACDDPNCPCHIECPMPFPVPESEFPVAMTNEPDGLKVINGGLACDGQRYVMKTSASSKTFSSKYALKCETTTKKWTSTYDGIYDSPPKYISCRHVADNVKSNESLCPVIDVHKHGRYPILLHPGNETYCPEGMKLIRWEINGEGWQEIGNGLHIKSLTCEAGDLKLEAVDGTVAWFLRKDADDWDPPLIKCVPLKKIHGCDKDTCDHISDCPCPTECPLPLPVPASDFPASLKKGFFEPQVYGGILRCHGQVFVAKTSADSKAFTSTTTNFKCNKTTKKWTNSKLVADKYMSCGLIDDKEKMLNSQCAVRDVGYEGNSPRLIFVHPGQEQYCPQGMEMIGCDGAGAATLVKSMNCEAGDLKVEAANGTVTLYPKLKPRGRGRFEDWARKDAGREAPCIRCVQTLPVE